MNASELPWFTFMTGPTDPEEFRELLEPILPFVRGVVCTFHGEREDLGAAYLESVKGAGKIIYLPYSGRHDFSRNAYLYCGPIKHGDWVLSCDALERIPQKFASYAPFLIDDLKKEGINLVYYYGKPFLYQFHESLIFNGSPHEGLFRQDGLAKGAELNRAFPDESDVRVNIRPIKRPDPHHFVDHYAKYYISLPWGSNHCLLGNEKRGEPMKLFREREAVRVEFRDYLRGLGVPLTVAGFKKYLTDLPMSDKMKDFINKERILNDFYRYYMLNDKTVRDDHTWEGMIKL